METNFPLKEIMEAFAKVLRNAPRVLGNDALNFFLESFKRQGWQGATFEPWAPRKYANKDKGRAILIKTARLRRSLRITSETNDSSTIGTDVPYARPHNEGLSQLVNQSVKAHTRKGRLGKIQQVKAHSRAMQMNMPRRQFLGESPVLTKQLIQRLTNDLLKASQI